MELRPGLQLPGVGSKGGLVFTLEIANTVAAEHDGERSARSQTSSGASGSTITAVAKVRSPFSTEA